MTEQIEHARKNILLKHEEEQRQKMESLAVIDSMQDLQIQSDSIFINTMLIKWIKGAKNPQQKTSLNGLMVSFMRISSYLSTLQFTIKRLGIRNIDLKRSIKKLQNENNQLNKRIKILEDINSDYEKGRL